MNPQGPDPKYHFKKGHPKMGGRALGTKDKLTQFKEKLIAAALDINLNDRKIRRSDLLKIAAGFVPKEVKADVRGAMEIRWIE